MTARLQALLDAVDDLMEAWYGPPEFADYEGLVLMEMAELQALAKARAAFPDDPEPTAAPAAPFPEDSMSPIDYPEHINATETLAELAWRYGDLGKPAVVSGWRFVGFADGSLLSDGIVYTARDLRYLLDRIDRKYPGVGLEIGPSWVLPDRLDWAAA